MTEKGEQLRAYANYLVQTLPRWIQEARVSQLDELEVLSLSFGRVCPPANPPRVPNQIMIEPEGVIPVMTFLRDHTNAQFRTLIDIAGVDVPTRVHRFEVQRYLLVFLRRASLTSMVRVRLCTCCFQRGTTSASR